MSHVTVGIDFAKSVFLLAIVLALNLIGSGLWAIARALSRKD